MKLVIASLAALVLSAPAMGQVAGTVGANQVETGQRSNNAQGQCERGATVNGERCVCRRIEVESSSRMSVRSVCMTASQWRQWERER